VAHWQKEIDQHPSLDSEHLHMLTNLAEAYMLVEPAKADTLL